jgi:hypothetical protein
MAPQPVRRSFQCRRQIVVAELDRSELHVVDLVLRVIGPGQLGCQPGLVESQVY